MQLKFFKQNNNWYADVPNHTLDENEMVMGSDILLDFISNGKDKVVLDLELEQPEQFLLCLNRTSIDSEGAYYSISGRIYLDYLDTLTSENVLLNEIWICNVTLDVFNCFPKNIYITQIS